MAGQGWVSLLNDPPAIAAITSNTFTGPQDITIGTTGTLGSALSVPVGGFLPGQSWRFHAAGTYSVTGTPTLVLGLYVGSAAQAANTAFTASSGVTAMNWELDATGIVRSVGPTTAGTMLVTGSLSYAVTSNTAARAILPIAAAPMAVGTGFDTTIANLLTLKATYSASSASNIVVVHQWLAEYLN